MPSDVFCLLLIIVALTCYTTMYFQYSVFRLLKLYVMNRRSEAKVIIVCEHNRVVLNELLLEQMRVAYGAVRQGVEEMPKGGLARSWFSMCFYVCAVLLFLLCCLCMSFL